MATMKDKERKAFLNRRSHLKTKYGLTVEDYERMLVEQGYGCAICGDPQGDSHGSSLHVDHNAETGCVRGLLCGNCNRAIGQLNHNPDRVLAAAFYLVEHDGVLDGVS